MRKKKEEMEEFYVVAPFPHLAHGAIVGMSQHEDLGARGEVLLRGEVHLVARVVHANVLHQCLEGIRLPYF